MILPKGGKRHRKIGRLFVTGMMLTGGSALLMAQIKPNPFLFIIGVFTIYLVGTADRYIKLKQNKPLLIDWVYTLGMFVFGSIFIIWGIITLTKSGGMGATMLVFGSIGLYGVYQDFNNYQGEAAHRKYRFVHPHRADGGWFYSHCDRSIGCQCTIHPANNSNSGLLVGSYPSLYSIKYLLD